MIPFNLGSGRAAYYDRNPKYILLQFQNQLAPHTPTINATYTVPANRKAQIEHINVHIMRMVAPTTAGAARCVCFLTPSGGVACNLAVASIFDAANGAKDSEIVGTGGTLTTGDFVGIQDVDASSGGQIFYDECVKIVEYDA